MSEISEETREDQENPEELTEDGVSVEEEEQEEEKPKAIHLHTRSVPTIVMLSGGAAAAIYTFVRHDELLTSLVIIFVSLVIFLVIGDLVKILLDTITIEPPEEENKDKVIERAKGEDQPEGGNEESAGSRGNAGSPEEIQT